jgi:predicted ATP-dependent endonuclease of OLD family
MSTYKLEFELISDTTFGSSSGVGQLVDIDIQQDKFGCPFLGARALKGVLEDECANILYSLHLQKKSGNWEIVADRLFGLPGKNYNATILRFENAELPKELHHAIVCEIKNERVTVEEILESLTTIRRQTSINPGTETAREKSLRSMRVILRKTPFEAILTFTGPEEETDLQLLAATVMAFRRVGTYRNRGLGELKARLYKDANDITQTQYDAFRNAVKKEVGS